MASRQSPFLILNLAEKLNAKASWLLYSEKGQAQTFTHEGYGHSYLGIYILNYTTHLPCCFYGIGKYREKNQRLQMS